jgi:hypothetical protein
METLLHLALALVRQSGQETLHNRVLYSVLISVPSIELNGSSRRGEHNFFHPRTDVVVIMVAIDISGEKILLGRNVRRSPLFRGYHPYCTARENFEEKDLILPWRDFLNPASPSRLPFNGKCWKKQASMCGTSGIILRNLG